MENIILIISLRRKLDQVVVNEQVENGDAINKNLSAVKIVQQFITLLILNLRFIMWLNKKL
jgi:hypothetical protein